ncbi:hypothetical protein ACI2UW_24235 [Ralstonia nicotianae]
MTTTHVAQHQNSKLGRALQPLMFRDLVPLTKPSHRTQVVERCCWHGTKEDQQ